jgi:hypothetical protein
MANVSYYLNTKLAVLTFEIVMQTDAVTRQAFGFMIRRNIKAVSVQRTADPVF